MNKTIYYAIVILFLFSSCAKKQDVPKRIFIEDVRLKTTPVKSQGYSQFCWVYAMLATIETEHLMQGDSVNLSEDYVARMWLQQATRDSYFSKGAKVVDMRGFAPMTLRLLETYGVEPYASFHQREDVNYHVVCNKLRVIAQNAAHRQLGLQRLDKEIGDFLDGEIDFLPRYVFMAGAEYTPKEFGHSVCRPHEYVALTSFTHHPFGQEFVLELPDNQTGEKALNIPLDTLMRRIDTSIRTGHPVCWEGDITEPGFSFARGIATLTKQQTRELAHTKDTMALRQQAFERFATTDDHCMELMGIAHSGSGRKYYIAKSSWGDNNPYGGYIYMSEDYIRMKTILVIVKNE